MTLAPVQGAFSAWVVVVALACVATLGRYLPRRDATAGTVALLVWLAWAGGVAASGLMADPTARPPGIAWLAVPSVVAIVGVLGLGRGGARLAAAVPLALLLGMQVFRVGVEAVLHALHELGRVPSLMTLSGGNVEAVVALAAPVAAWASTRGRTGRRVAWAWNLVGLLSLANVVARGVLSAPGPLQRLSVDVPNVAIGHLPFSYIPGFMVPLALSLHVLAWRALRAADRADAGASTGGRSAASTGSGDAARAPSGVPDRDGLQRSALEARIPPPLLLLATALAMTACARLLPAPSLAFDGDRILALAVAAAGFAVLAAGALRFRAAGTTIDPTRPADASSLVDGGIYRFTRNPMYVGFALMLAAWALALGSPWAWIGPPAFVAWLQRYQIEPEERALRRVFGERYDAYARRVRRWV